MMTLPGFLFSHTLVDVQKEGVYTRNPKPEIRNPKLETLKTTPLTPNPRPETLYPEA